MFYRAWQFFRAAFARVHKHEYALVERYLLPAQVALFRRMAPCDRRHGLDVFYTLRDAGYQDRALLQAALLHDVGKAAARLTIWHRVGVVLMGRLVPDWLARLAADGRGWRAPLAAHAQHAQTGALWATRVDCSLDTVELIRLHHRADLVDKRLAALRWADKRN